MKSHAINVQIAAFLMPSSNKIWYFQRILNSWKKKTKTKTTVIKIGTFITEKCNIHIYDLLITFVNVNLDK